MNRVISAAMSMKKWIKRLVSIAALFWCCFWYEIDGQRVFIQGNPQHFEGWYDEAGKEQMIIWMGDVEYIVYTDDMMMYYYDDENVGYAIG